MKVYSNHLFLPAPLALLQKSFLMDGGLLWVGKNKILNQQGYKNNAGMASDVLKTAASRLSFRTLNMN